jgi:hypothetical protein
MPLLEKLSWKDGNEKAACPELRHLILVRQLAAGRINIFTARAALVDY